MKVVHFFQSLLTDTETADQSKPTDQAVSNQIREAKDASISRQEARATRQRRQNAMVDVYRHQREDGQI